MALSPFLLLAFVLGFGGLLVQTEGPESTPARLAGAARVLDADTLEIRGHRVRLDGIDAPEKRQACRRNGRRYQCGVAATQALRRRIGGQMADGTDLNGWVVEQGWALAYRRYSTRYVAQEERAQAAQAGLWAGEFVPPWEWRRGAR